MGRRARAPVGVFLAASVFVVVSAVVTVWFASRDDGGADRPGGMAGARTVTASERAPISAPIETPGGPVDGRRDADVSLADVDEALAVLVVRVLDAQGTPLANRRLFVERTDRPRENALRAVEGPSGDLELAPLSGADGHVEFTVPARVPLELRTYDETPALVRAVTPLAPHERREVDLALAADDERIGSRVIEGVTRAPIVGANVLDFSRGTSSLTLARVVARTDADGRFRVARKAFTGERFAVTADGHGPRLGSLARMPGTIELERGGTLALRIDVADESPVRPSALIVAPLAPLALDADSTNEAEVVAWTRALPSGNLIEFADLPPAVPLDVRVELQRRRSGPRTERVELAPGERRELAFGFREPSAVVGRVTRHDERGALPGQEVWLAPCDVPAANPRGDRAWDGATIDGLELRVTSTDDDGHFRFEAVPPGRWRVGTPRRDRMQEAATSTMHSVETVTTTVTIAGDGSDMRAELHPTVGGLIAGHVVDPAGQPVAGARVVASPLGIGARWPLGVVDEDRNAVTTALDGSFAIGPFVQFDFRGFDDEGLTLQARSHSDTFTDSAPLRVDGPRADVVLRLQRPCKLVVTAIRDAAAVEGMRWAQLVAAQQSDPSAGPRAFEGAAEFEQLTPGRYCVLVTLGDEFAGRSDWIDLTEADPVRDVRVELGLAAVIELVPENDSAESTDVRCVAELFVDGVWIRSEHLTRGASRRLVVPAGAYRLEIGWIVTNGQRATTLSRTLDVELTPGETRVVRLED